MSKTIHILFVDASADDVHIAQWQLRQAGLQTRVERVDTATALRAALENRTPDLLIAEFEMPGFGGIEALRVMGWLKLEIPAIVYSGYPDAASFQEALTLGAYGCVSKDDASEFVALVRSALTARAHPPVDHT